MLKIYPLNCNQTNMAALFSPHSYVSPGMQGEWGKINRGCCSFPGRISVITGMREWSKRMLKRFRRCCNQKRIYVRPIL